MEIPLQNYAVPCCLKSKTTNHYNVYINLFKSKLIIRMSQLFSFSCNATFHLSPSHSNHGHHAITGYAANRDSTYSLSLHLYIRHKFCIDKGGAVSTKNFVAKHFKVVSSTYRHALSSFHSCILNLPFIFPFWSSIMVEIMRATRRQQKWTYKAHVEKRPAI